MPSDKKKRRPVLVQVETPNLIPERDLGSIPVLQAEHLGIDFGGLTAVDDFNIAMGRTEISGLIGPNGAGKTTIFNLLTNVYKPTRGTVLIDGYDTAGKSVADVNRMGIARTFQNIRLFSKMTVEQNVLVGFGNTMKTHLITDMLRLPGHWKQEAEFHDRALELLDIFDMRKYADTQAGNLPYGAQRRLEILRALAAAARRARRRHEPGGDRGADGEHPEDPRRVPDRHSAHRARHVARHGRVRSRWRAGLR